MIAALRVIVIERSTRRWTSAASGVVSLMSRSYLQQHAGQEDLRDREVDDDAADVDERRDERRGGVRGVGLELAERERQHRAGEGSPHHAAGDGERDGEADDDVVIAVAARGAP